MGTCFKSFDCFQITESNEGLKGGPCFGATDAEIICLTGAGVLGAVTFSAVGRTTMEWEKNVAVATGSKTFSSAVGIVPYTLPACAWVFADALLKALV
jgi:hypothetical protein